MNDSPSTVDVDRGETYRQAAAFVRGMDEPVSDVARRMADEGVHRVIVVEGERVVGIVTSLDILKVFPT